MTGLVLPKTQRATIPSTNGAKSRQEIMTKFVVSKIEPYEMTPSKSVNKAKTSLHDPATIEIINADLMVLEALFMSIRIANKRKIKSPSF